MNAYWPRMLLGAVLAVCACGPAQDAPLWPSVHPASGPLNTVFEVRLGAAPDPLSITDRSVRVTRDDGRELAARVTARPDGLGVALILDSSVWADPPASAVVHVLGGASSHALLRQDGRPWSRSWELRLHLAPELVGGTSPGLVLRDPLEATVVDGRLRLEFSGVLDPASVDALSVPLFPEANGDRLAPRYGSVVWRVVGGDTSVEVDLAGLTGTLWCSTRRLGLRAWDGSPPEPRVELRLPPR